MSLEIFFLSHLLLFQLIQTLTKMMIINIINYEKYVNKSIFVPTFFAAFFTACEDVDMVQIDPNTVVSLSTNNVILLEDNASENAVTVSWTPRF